MYQWNIQCCFFSARDSQSLRNSNASIDRCRIHSERCVALRRVLANALIVPRLYRCGTSTQTHPIFNLVAITTRTPPTPFHHGQPRPGPRIGGYAQPRQSPGHDEHGGKLRCLPVVASLNAHSVQLISSGQYINHVGQNAGHIQLAFKRSVTVASERFHDSLDELETEIIQAQTVLRRDLALMKADRKKREAAAKEKEAEKARLAAESSAQKPAPALKKEDSPKPPSPAPVKIEPPVKNSTPPEQPPEPPVSVQKESTPPLPAPEASAVISDALPDAPTEDAATNLAPQDTEFDFDALFGDTMDTTGGEGDDQGDLNLDGDGHDLSFSLDDSGPSLLPGLEDYAKSGDDGPTQDTNANVDLDLPMPDVPSVPDAPASKPTEEAAAQQTTNDDLNLDAMTANSLDDLFDMDYTNPEDSQFDDAFFGFGE